MVSDEKMSFYSLSKLRLFTDSHLLFPLNCGRDERHRTRVSSDIPDFSWRESARTISQVNTMLPLNPDCEMIISTNPKAMPAAVPKPGPRGQTRDLVPFQGSQVQKASLKARRIPPAAFIFIGNCLRYTLKLTYLSLYIRK